jgi:plastocyanin
LAWRSSLLVAVTLAGSSPAWADDVGTISGAVTLVRLGVASHVTGPADVVVYLEDAPAVGALPAGPFVITQAGKAFRPDLLIVPVGARVEFPNQDAFFHNVFATAAGNSFDLGLYKGGASKSVLFAKPGLVPIFCNIHPQMISYILVVTNPFFTHPDGDGGFRFAGVPPGTYHLVAWLPYGNPVRTEVVVAAGQTAEVAVTVRERSDAQRHPNKEGKPYGSY